MTIEPLLLTANLYEYFKAVGYRESAHLQEIREHVATFPEGHMQTGPEVVQLIAFFIRLTQAKHILELGTFGGYSAVGMAEALPKDGKIITCDNDPETSQVAQEFWEKFGYGHQIELRLGKALETLDQLAAEGKVFDLVYIDADKQPYDQYYEYSLRLLKPRGIIVLDNTLQRGRVADSSMASPSLTTVRELNKKIHVDPRVFALLLPFSDGVTIVLKN